MIGRYHSVCYRMEAGHGILNKAAHVPFIRHRRCPAAFVTQPSFEGRDCDNQALVTMIFGIRQHVSTDNLPEYRVEVCPSKLVSELAQTGIKGNRSEPGGNPAAFDDDLIEGSSQTKKKTPQHIATRSA
jgi:hypothetical protein